MATALFIKPIDLKRNSIIDGNVDIDRFNWLFKNSATDPYKKLFRYRSLQ